MIHTMKAGIALMLCVGLSAMEFVCASSTTQPSSVDSRCSTKNTYEQLKQLVDSKALSITYIDAPPRTISTALLRSLAHVMDTQCNEPFHANENTFEVGCSTLLHAAQMAGVYSDSTRKPIRLVVKEAPRYLPINDWQKLMPLIDNFITLVRDPHLQLHSCVRRSANDLHFNKKGKDLLSDAEIAALANQVGDLFEHGGIIAGQRIPGGFERTSWGLLHSHATLLFEHLKENPHKSFMVVSAFLLCASPRDNMSEILTRLGIACNDKTLDRVTTNWDQDSKKCLSTNGKTHPDDYAYTKVAMSATGYRPPLTKTPLLCSLPKNFQKHLCDEALPTYVQLLSQSNCIGARTPEQLNAILQMTFNGVTLVERNQVEAYAHLVSLDATTLTPDQNLHKKQLLALLRGQFPEYSDSFDLIDAIVLHESV